MNDFYSRAHKLFVGLILYILPVLPLSGQIVFNFGADYRYLKGSEAADLPETWMLPDFDDSTWDTGIAPFRYGDGTGGTLLDDMRYAYSTLYLRTSFIAENIMNIKDIEIQSNYDDGFIIWLNGEKLISKNAPAEPAYNALAPADHESGSPEYSELDSSEFNLIEGENILAVQCFNVLLSSSDIYFDLAVHAALSLPEVSDSLRVIFSHPSGFYDEIFDMTLTSPSTDYQIVYTLDGSNPQTSTTAITENSPVIISVDPASSENRPATPDFMVRASLVKPDYSPSKSRVRNYIFIEAIKNQSHPGGEWPLFSVNGQLIDLNMDSQVLNDSRYADLLDEAMLQIPSIAVTTDLKNLFDQQQGIYVNAREHGSDWERECSVEYIRPDETKGFQVNAGLRIRGGNSRNSDNPKHAFRLFFREEYGDAKLDFPLFGTTGASSFDKLDLRTAQNYSWSMDGSDHNTFVRDIFSRDAQLDMGSPSTRGDYFHLFLNGMYWGLFQTEERPEARYAASYFGDDKEDYDVIKVAVEAWPYFNEATDGNMEAWTELWQLCEQGFTDNTAYFGLEGKDEWGNPVKNSRVLVDIDNLIDFMLVIFYTGNVDAPVSAWHSNNMPNNYYAIYNRKNKGSGFIFIAHDSEHCLFYDPIYVHDGLYENRVTIDDPPMSATGIYDFQPQWLHQKLCRNAEYRLRFSDRAHRHLSAGGALSSDSCVQRFTERADEMDMAIIAESARWGDAKVSYPRNKMDDWVPEINDVVFNLMAYRTDIVIEQLIEADLYTELLPPALWLDGQPVYDEFLYFDGSAHVSIENENGTGTIYYTLNGRDPRETGGSISGNALSAANAIELELTGSALITARVKDGEEWSALTRSFFSLAEENYDGLRITELSYHPEDVIVNNDTTSGKAYEFIELKNISEHAMNISGLKMDSAVHFTVPEGTILPPMQFYVVASKPEKFYDIYGKTPSGNFSGNLSNSEEYILLTDPEGNSLISLTYSDQEPWPAEADGEGYTLVAKEILPGNNPGDPAYWRKSYYKGGSPFADDLIVSVEEPIADNSDDNLLLYPNPVSDRLHIRITNAAPGEMLHVRIIDMRGRVLLTGEVRQDSGLTLTGTGITPGMYLVRIDCSAGTYFKKMIFQK